MVLWDIDLSEHLRKFAILIFACTNSIFHFSVCNVFDFKPFLYYKLTQKTQNSILQSNIQVEKNCNFLRRTSIGFSMNYNKFSPSKSKMNEAIMICVLHNDVEQG